MNTDKLPLVKGDGGIPPLAFAKIRRGLGGFFHRLAYLFLRNAQSLVRTIQLFAEFFQTCATIICRIIPFRRGVLSLREATCF